MDQNQAVQLAIRTSARKEMKDEILNRIDNLLKHQEGIFNETMKTRGDGPIMRDAYHMAWGKVDAFRQILRII